MLKIGLTSRKLMFKEIELIDLFLNLLVLFGIWNKKVTVNTSLSVSIPCGSHRKR